MFVALEIAAGERPRTSASKQSPATVPVWSETPDHYRVNLLGDMGTDEVE
jgi:hypothetical protein